MMNNIIKKFFKIILKIILLPIYVLKGIKNIFMQLFRSLKFSIRKKISFNYLFLYTIICLLTMVVVIMAYIPYEVNQKNLDVGLMVESIVSQYEQDIYDEIDLEQRLNYISRDNNCGIEITIINQEKNMSPIIVKTELYNNYDYPDNFWEKVQAVFGEKVYSRNVSMLNYDNLNENDKSYDNEYRIKILYALYPFYEGFLFIMIVLCFCFACGFFFLGIVGGIKSRQVLEPIYTMTKTAEKISINDMGARLDVSKTKYELKDLANTLNDMLDRLNEDYEKQKRFVSDVSHELRTPISIINGYANMLERWGKEDEEVLNESIEAIIDEAKNMQLLVVNLLTLVRSDNQTLQYNQEEFYMDELVFDAIKETSMIDEVGHRISYDLGEQVKVNLDYSKTKQMLRIFLDNAIKYTPQQGAINIKVYSKDNMCHIHIKDSGIGISKEDLPHLFDRFYRSDESRTRQTGGHGLGLAIAKVIVIGQSGKIKVKSKLGEGSEFIIMFPKAYIKKG